MNKNILDKETIDKYKELQLLMRHIISKEIDEKGKPKYLNVFIYHNYLSKNGYCKYCGYELLDKYHLNSKL
jgi:hypothetical protein